MGCEEWAMFKKTFTFLLMLAAIYSPWLFANNSVCPDGNNIVFTPTLSTNTGYFYGTTTDGTPLESDIITIPSEFIDDGYTIVYESESANPTVIACTYHLLDNVTGETTFPIFLVSTIQH